MNKKTKKGQKHLKTMLLPFYYIYIIQDICIMHYALFIMHYSLYIISASNQISSCINSQEDKEKYREAP